MKTITLKKIQLSNFKSLNLEVEFNEGATKISGKNGLGKTSIASAFYWLLSSYTNPYVPKNFALFDDIVDVRGVFASQNLRILRRLGIGPHELRTLGKGRNRPFLVLRQHEHHRDEHLRDVRLRL